MVVSIFFSIITPIEPYITPTYVSQHTSKDEEELGQVAGLHFLQLGGAP